MREDWDSFWGRLESQKGFYSRFLSLYRIQIVARALNYYINRYFPPSGIFVECGAGTSETTLRTEKKDRKFIALDFSHFILKKSMANPKMDSRVNADIFTLPFKDNSVDGIWNVGVMEHFVKADIDKILKEFHRVLKKDRPLILFWPMAYAPYEIFINIVEFMVNLFAKKRFRFYPEEVSRLASRKQAREYLRRHDFKDVHIFFNFRDAFSFGVLVGTK